MCASEAFKCPACGKWTEDYGKDSPVCIECELDFEIAQDSHEAEGGVVYSTSNPRDHHLDDDMDGDDYDLYDDDSDAPILVNPCPSCHSDEVYHSVLSRGLCLNCYHTQIEDERMMEVEYAHDRAQGLI